MYCAPMKVSDPYILEALTKVLQTNKCGVVRWCEGGVYLASPGHPVDIDLQLGKACYPCSR